MHWHLFLDESGDLGFNFEQRNPSNYLTIAILAMSHPGSVRAIEKGVEVTLRRKINRKKKKHPKQELKGSNTAIEVKRYFYSKIESEEFGVYAITMNKRRIARGFERGVLEKDRLYNYLASRVLSGIPFAPDDEAVTLVVDKSKASREIEVFNRHLENELEGRVSPEAPINIYHRQSTVERCLSAVDLFCWGIFRSRERNDHAWLDVYREKVHLDDEYHLRMEE